MKKYLAYILVFIFGLLCGFSTFKNYMEKNTITASNNNSNLWIIPEEKYCHHYDSLNLDGLGINDDSIYVSSYRWGSYLTANTVMQILLGTGTHLAIIFEGQYDANILTDYLDADNKESIVLELIDPWSTVGQCQVYILSVESQKDVSPYVKKQLYIGDNIATANNAEQVIEMPIIVGTQLITESETGVIINSLSFDNGFESCQQKILYEKHKWELLSG